MGLPRISMNEQAFVMALLCFAILTYLLHGAEYYLKADCHSAYQKISCFIYGT
jgi:hypothetical protein